MRINLINKKYGLSLFFLTIHLVFLICFGGCKKKDNFLNKKPSTNIAIPTSLQDFQALLDNVNLNQDPPMGEASADNYYESFNFWQTTSALSQNTYIWAPDIFQGNSDGINDWNGPYNQVFVSNVVLEGLKKIVIDSTNYFSYNLIKGNALFKRAYAFFNLVQLFAPVYDSITANSDLGIPLRLNPNIDERSERASLKRSYDQIISDINEAKELLPTTIDATYRIRPCKPACFALLARLFLSIRAYSKAFNYADSCLQLYNVLINYNTIANSTTLYNPFTRYNAETIYHSGMYSQPQYLINIAGSSNGISVDTTLFRSYIVNDLRKSIYYYVYPSNGAINTNGTYTGTRTPFTGLATDEMYLVRAECAARLGNVTAAMNDLDTLLKNRWKLNTYMPYTPVNATDALNKILAERRKEMPFRGVRWSDLRRLNKEGFNITLVRNLNGQIYTLNPNSPLYVLPIPPAEIILSGIPQNPR